MNLIKIGSLGLFIQNTMYYLFIVDRPDIDDAQIYRILLNLDLIGFALLSLGWFLRYLETNSRNTRYLLASIGILGWMINRLYWQYIMFWRGDFNLGRFIFVLVLSAAFLLISGLQGLNYGYLLYTLSNFLVIVFFLVEWYFTSPAWSIYAKVVIIPGLGMYAFASIFEDETIL